MKELTQSKNFAKRELRLTESKLFYNYSKFGNSNEIDIPFENIEGEKVTHKTSNNVILFFSAVVYVVSIAVFVGRIRNGSGEELRESE